MEEKKQLSLSLSSPTSILPPVKRLEVICSAPYQQTPDQLSKRYVSHPLYCEGSEIKQWPTATSLPCYHCLDGFTSAPFFLPTDYRAERGEYVGYGIFCSPSCVKRYAIEHSTYNTPNQLTYLAQFCREMGIKETVIPAPPQIRLKRLGGDLDTEAFRGMAKQGIQVITQHAPFITWAMVFEERRRQEMPTDSKDTSTVATVESFPGILQKPDEERWQIRGLRAPTEPLVVDNGIMDMDVCQPLAPAYDQFLEQKKLLPVAATTVAKTAPLVEVQRGSTMKATTTKRKGRVTGTVVTNNNTAKKTKTSTNELPLVPKQPSLDVKRGSLRAFMKQRQVQ